MVCEYVSLTQKKQRVRQLTLHHVAQCTIFGGVKDGNLIRATMSWEVTAAPLQQGLAGFALHKAVLFE